MRGRDGRRPPRPRGAFEQSDLALDEAKGGAQRKLLFPDATSFESQSAPAVEGLNSVYKADTGAWVFDVTSAQGYHGDVELMIGINADGTVAGIQVVAEDETDGIGTNALTEEYFGGFAGSPAAGELTVDEAGAGQTHVDAGLRRHVHLACRGRLPQYRLCRLRPDGRQLMALNENIVREQDARISKMVHTPTFLVVAGALPGLFAATSLENGLMIGLVTAAAIVVMASIAPLLRAFTGTWSRTAVMLMVSVTVVTLLGFGVRVTDPVVFEALGIYLPLVAVNAIVVAWIAGDGLVVARQRRRS